MRDKTVNGATVFLAMCFTCKDEWFFRPPR